MKNVHNVEITLEGSQWSNILDGAFKKKQKDVKIDGFRKGSVPKDVYIKKMGIESLYMDAVDAAMSEAYKKVLNEQKLIPEIEPKVDVKEINENKVVFVFTIITKPEITLGKYKDLKVKKDGIKVSEEEIDEEIKALQSKMAEIVIKEKGKVENGNTAVIDFEGKVDGKVIDGGTGENYPLEIGSNTFIPGFEEALIGMKVGTTKDINLTFPDNYTEELANKDVVFKVTLREIKERILPKLDEDFYKDLGHENVKDNSEFRKIIKEEIEHKKSHDVENKYIEDVLEAASSNMKGDINEEIIHEEIHRMMHQYEEQLKMQGLNIDQYLEFTKSSKEDLEKMMEPEATKRVRYRYFLEALADKEQIEISDKEAESEAEGMAANYGMEKTEFISAFGGLEMIKYDLKMRKAIELLKD